MDTAKNVTIATVDAECSCGGPLTQNGSFAIVVMDSTPILCQTCGKEHKLPAWILKRNAA